MNILDFLGIPVQERFIFRQGIEDKTNDFLRLSFAEYGAMLYGRVVDEMRLMHSDGTPISNGFKKQLKKGRIPTYTETRLRSGEFEREVGKAAVVLYDADRNIKGTVVNTLPRDGYKEFSGINEKQKEQLRSQGGISEEKLDEICARDYHDIPFLNPQAHMWEALFAEDVHGAGLTHVGLMMAVRLSQLEGAKYITLNTSRDSKDLKSTRLCINMMKSLGLRLLLGERPMYDKDNRVNNYVRTWYLDLNNSHTMAQIGSMEQQLIHKFYR